MDCEENGTIEKGGASRASRVKGDGCARSLEAEGRFGNGPAGKDDSGVCLRGDAVFHGAVLSPTVETAARSVRSPTGLAPGALTGKRVLGR